ncbi:MAG: sigma-70 family RNA polymerase sigma factor [Candidatus Eremiobacteraeota bacterium]|nr:sigma-70 family RNA polymerase sigma factor [Candidatus Eremiobacteraeota bacterium]
MTDPHADVRAARDGDRAALDRLLTALWPRAFRLAAGITQHAATAEDAAQDALVLVATRLPSLRDPAAYPAWSTRIVVNAATTALRRCVADAAADDRGTAPGFEDALAERLDVLHALGTLPLWLRVPIVLRYVDDLSSREIGLALGVPAATIRFRLALGRRRLAAALDAAGRVSEEFA